MALIFPQDHLPFPPIEHSDECNGIYCDFCKEIEHQDIHTIFSFTSHSVMLSQLLVVLHEIIDEIHKFKELYHINKEVKGEYAPATEYSLIGCLSSIMSNFESKNKKASSLPLLLNNNFNICSLIQREIEFVFSKDDESESGSSIDNKPKKKTIEAILDNFITLIQNKDSNNNHEIWKDEININLDLLNRLEKLLTKVFKELKEHINDTKLSFASNIQKSDFPNYLLNNGKDHILSSNIWDFKAKESKLQNEGSDE